MQPCLSYLSQQQGTTLGTHGGENATCLFIRISDDGRPHLDWAVRRRMTQPASSWGIAGGGVVTWCLLLPPQSHPAYCLCRCHVQPIFTSLPSSSSSLSTNFCARYTFKALNIIHYNAVHSRHLACGMRQVQNLHSPPLPPLQPSTDQVPLWAGAIFLSSKAEECTFNWRWLP